MNNHNTFIDEWSKLFNDYKCDDSFKDIPPDVLRLMFIGKMFMLDNNVLTYMETVQKVRLFIYKMNKLLGDENVILINKNHGFIINTTTEHYVFDTNKDFNTTMNITNLKIILNFGGC